MHTLKHSALLSLLKVEPIVGPIRRRYTGDGLEVRNRQSGTSFPVPMSGREGMETDRFPTMCTLVLLVDRGKFPRQAFPLATLSRGAEWSMGLSFIDGSNRISQRRCLHPGPITACGMNGSTVHHDLELYECFIIPNRHCVAVARIDILSCNGIEV